jgi:hypothetical protein
MKQQTSKPASWLVLVSLLAMATATVYAADAPPFGANDPYRPYDQRTAAPADTGAPHEGLYLNTDLGVSFVQDTSTLKPDAGVRFSIGPGYTLHSSPDFEVGAQFETGMIYNSVNQVQTTLNSPGIRTPTINRKTSGDLFQVPFLVDIVYAWHVVRILVPYFGVGGGAVYRDLNSTSLGSSSSTDAAVQAR